MAEPDLLPNEVAALSVIAKWNGETLTEISRKTLISLIETELGDMEFSASGRRCKSGRATAWAKECMERVKPFIGALGWNGQSMTRRA
ncbi:MAG: hypothetical protein ACOYM3_16900 [Terrimicrobiaceae bacterium]